MARFSTTTLVVVLFVGCCAASSVVRPTRWGFLGPDGRPVSTKFRQDEFGAGRIKCLRCCVEGKPPDARFLELAWRLAGAGNGTGEMGSAAAAASSSRADDKDDSAPESVKTNASRNFRCAFSVIAGCETPTGTDVELDEAEESFSRSLRPAAGDIFSNLVDKDGLCGHETEISFEVPARQAELGVVVLGKVTEIDLKIPLGGQHDYASTTRLTLSTSGISSENTTTTEGEEGEEGQQQQTAGVRVSVLNPPPGGYRLAFRGGRRVLVDAAESTTLDYDGELRVDSTKKEPGISARQLRYNQMEMGADESNVDQQQYLPGMVYDEEATGNTDDVQRPFQFPSDNGIGNVTTLEDRILTDRERTLSEGNFNSLGSQELPLRKYLNVELNSNSNLVAGPGTPHRLTFDVTNNHIIPIRHYLNVNAPPPLRLLRLSYPMSPPYPPYTVIIEPGQTISVSLELYTPFTASDAVYKVSLQVEGFVRVEKTVNLYVRPQGSRVYDDTKPWLNYYFNNNCNGRTSAEKCSKSYWSVDVTVQDNDSGLKSVASTPNGIYAYSEFLSGTTSPVYFYYSNTCCNQIMRVTAMDLSGNVYTQEIDVGIWWNLSGGEITAVVLGVLLIILIIVLIALSIVYCKQKQSLDLPYSQRYGSRASPRSAE